MYDKLELSSATIPSIKDAKGQLDLQSLRINTAKVHLVEGSKSLNIMQDFSCLRGKIIMTLYLELFILVS